MNIQESKLAQFQKIVSDALKSTNDGLTREEFMKAFDAVYKYVQKIQKTNDSEWTMIHSALQMLESKLQADTASDFSTLKEEITTATQTLEDKVDSKLKQVDKKLSKIKNGDDGVDADEEKIIKTVLSQIEILKPTDTDSPEQIANKLETLKNDARLDASAIKNLPEVTKKLTQGVLTATALYSLADVNVAGIAVGQSIKWDGGQWIVYTPGSGGGGGGTLTEETPSGTVDGVNKIFTFLNIPQAIYVNGAYQIATIDYTISGLTVTFTFAPVLNSLIRSLYTVAASSGTPIGEVPTGLVNGSNKVFTLSHTPSPASAVQLQIGRQPQIQGTDYTISGTTITYVTAPDVSLAGTHYATYFF